MKTFYAHFGEDGITRVLPEGVEPPVKSQSVLYNASIRAALGPLRHCELVEGEIRRKGSRAAMPPPKRSSFSKRTLLIRIAQFAALAASFAAGHFV